MVEVWVQRFGHAGPIPHSGMEKDRPDGAADEGELFDRIGISVIHIELHGDTVSGHSGFEELLEIVGVVSPLEALPIALSFYIINRMR